MALEIERRFLVHDPSVIDGLVGAEIVQGYLPVDAPTSVRVRLDRRPGRERALLTLKHGLDALARSEFEYEIPLADAHAMLDEMCGPARVRKTRFDIEYAGRLWEIDRFEEANAPLLIAEVELDAPDAEPELPPWLGEEVTHDGRLLNVSLCARPFSTWPAGKRQALLGAQDSC